MDIKYQIILKNQVTIFKGSFKEVCGHLMQTRGNVKVSDLAKTLIIKTA